jgi:cell division protein FtsB
LKGKLKNKILKIELSSLRKKMNTISKENEELKKSKDKLNELIEIITMAENCRNEYDKIIKESKLVMKKYKRDLNKLLK